jgi:hypothetical protein
MYKQIKPPRNKSRRQLYGGHRDLAPLFKCMLENTVKLAFSNKH